jgi:hypothetical protein
MNNNFGGFKLQVAGQCRLHVGAGWSKLQVAGQFGSVQVNAGQCRLMQAG